MTRIVRSALVAPLALAALCPATADTPARPQTAADAAVLQQTATVATERAGRVISAGSPDGRAAAGFSASNVQFTSENGETSLSIAAAIEVQSYSAPDGEGYYRISKTKIGAVGTVPIDGKSKGGNLFAGDSLVSGSKLKLSVTRLSTRVGNGGDSTPQIAAAYKACVSQNATVWAYGQADRAGATPVAATVSAGLNAQMNGSGNINFDRIFGEAYRAGGAGKFIAQACSPGVDGAKFADESMLIEAYGDDPEGYRSRFLPKGAKLSFMGIDASFGREDHTYLDRAAFKLPSVPRTSWEAGAYYGQINSDLTFSWRIRGVYGQTYKDNDEAPLCRTVSIPAGTECIKGPDGAPLRQRTGLFSVEARKLVTVSDGTQIAIAPQITYKTKDSNIGVEVPIYLVPDEKGKLSGGIKAVYNSKGDEFAVGVFVGVPFSIFYN